MARISLVSGVQFVCGELTKSLLISLKDKLVIEFGISGTVLARTRVECMVSSTCFDLA